MYRLLVPTRVGMIPVAIAAEKMSKTCPHTRGDDPLIPAIVKHSLYLSPHAWG